MSTHGGDATAAETGTLDEVLGRTTIELSRALTPEEAEELLDHISRQIGGQVVYAVERRVSVGTTIRPVEEGARHTTSVQISGNVTTSKAGMSSFICLSPTNNPCRIVAIQFQAIPGYSLQEHRVEEVELWDQVKRIVDDYPRFD